MYIRIPLPVLHNFMRIFHTSALKVDHFAALRQPSKIPLLTGIRGIRPPRC